MRDAPLPPGSTIGILGGGQLGRMLAVAAARLGLKAHIYSDEAGAAGLRRLGRRSHDRQLCRRRRDRALSPASVDVVTCEFENVPAATLEAAVARGAGVPRGHVAFAVAQDRLVEKDFVTGLGIPVAPLRAQSTMLAALRAALSRVKLPAMLKTRRFGYDGKGQVADPRPGRSRRCV